MQRRSKQKDAIKSLLARKNYHPSVEAIYNDVKALVPGIGIATVYRNIEKLAEDGKIVKIELPGQGARIDGNVEKHYHFRCLRCGAIEDIDADDVVEKALRDVCDKSNNAISGHSVEFTGICEKCKASVSG